MIEKLEGLQRRYEELGQLIADPAVIASMTQWQKYMKEHARLTPLVEKFQEYKGIQQTLEETRTLLAEESDPELLELARQEVADLEAKRDSAERQLKVLLLPKDPNDEKNVIMEIRAGTGGEEAGLFAGDLFRMYSRFAERQGWRTELMDASPTDIGGFKEIIFVVEGRGAYSRLKYESGVHRVQRIPTTESGGRIHTSAATVAVLPEAEEVEVEIKPEDLRVDTFCASGHGGQSVNTTYSAVRVTHLPTGLVVAIQDEKSQLKNRDKALRILRARLLEQAQQAQQNEIAAARRSQVGTGDRSERIRTYNFPQSRVTDHRIGLTLYRLDMILDGDLDEIVTALITNDQAERLKATETEA
ncbi:MAG: peptide chain release factor 1 [Firmicutes bacterium]|nr:peptide chain release factor 1 [Bacillota bacterium]MCL5038445.1 peptide chain release factor 1 [Bacillota bacterium]